MNLKGKCKIMKVYISEDSMYKGHSLYHALVIKLKEMGLAGVTVTRGIEGYGKGKRISTARILELSASLPIIVEVVDLPELIESVIPLVEEMVNEGLVMVTDVNVIKYGKEGDYILSSPLLWYLDLYGAWARIICSYRQYFQGHLSDSRRRDSDLPPY